MSAITKRMSAAEFMEAADDCETIGTRPWRHGTRKTIVFEHDRAHWMADIDVHTQDGWQIYGDVTCTKVEKRKKTVEVWEPVEERAALGEEAK